MTVRDLVERSRSYRRFDESRSLDRETLIGFVDRARHTPAAANRQPLKYMIAWRPADNQRVFPHLRRAAALTDRPYWRDDAGLHHVPKRGLAEVPLDLPE